MSAEAMEALGASDWDDVCRGLDMLVAMQDRALWERLATGVTYRDGTVSFAKNAELAGVMGSPYLKAESSGDSTKTLRLRHVVVGLHALFQGNVSDVRTLRCDHVDDLHPLLRLPALEELEVSGDDADIEPLGRLTALRDLSMHRFRALSEEPGLSFIGNLQSLRSLNVDLADGSFSGSPLAGIEFLQSHPTLQELYLHWWNGGEEDLQIIASIPCLQSLALTYADEVYDYSALQSAQALKHLTLDLGGRNYGGLACLAHLHERGGLTLEDDEAAGVTTAVDLSALRSLSLAAAEELKACDQTVVLNGLPMISSEAVEMLTANGRNLYLDGLESVDVDLARILSRHTGYLSLRGVKNLGNDAAALMAARDTWFCMPLPESLNIETRKAIRENPWFIAPDTCHWPIATSPADSEPQYREDDGASTVLTADETLKVRSLLESGEENGVSLALALMAHVGPEGWRQVFDSEGLRIVADTWEPAVWGQFCELCSSADVLQAFTAAVARRLAAKAIEVDEPSEHVDLLETLDCEEIPAFLRVILRRQVTTGGADGESEDGDPEEADDADEDEDESRPDEQNAARQTRTRPWFL